MTLKPGDGGDLERRISEFQRGISADENFRWIFVHYYQRIFSYFARRGFATDRCDDLTQEVFLRVYRGVRGFRGEASFATWLFRIAWNLSCKRLRVEMIRERNAREVPLDETVEANGPSGLAVTAADTEEPSDPLDRVLGEERKALLQREIESMPPQMRRCIQLRVDGGLKYREIAALMQVSIDTVKSQLNQAKARLVDRLGAAGRGGSVSHGRH